MFYHGDDGALHVRLVAKLRLKNVIRNISKGCLRTFKYAAIDQAKSAWTTLGEPGDAMNHRSYADDGITIDAICTSNQSICLN